MKYWKAGIFFLIAFFIQTSLLNLISIGGYTPNLLLCLVVIFSFLYEKDMYGLVYGAVFGLIYDACYSYVIGPTPIALLIVAVLVLILREYANIENIISMWIVSAVSFFFYYFVNWGLYRIAGTPLGLSYAFSHAIWIVLYSLAVITVLYVFMIKRVIKYHKDRYFR